MKHLLILLFALPAILFGQTEHLVRPNTADTLSGTPNNNHCTYISPAVTQKDKLFLFLPGTGASPTTTEKY